ncbi:MAG TPA: PQQ-dependent sugar dehydrogenase [Rudaea sp.]|nr:PQQ-dependent sugar dehydrogenase [Rudaea sp.]
MYTRWLFLLAFLLAATATAQLPSDVELTVIVDSNAGLSSPVAVRSPNDGSGRLFVVEQGGTIKIFDTKGNALSQNFLTVSVTSGSEQGLLGLAFDPDFATTGTFYITYTAPSTDPKLGVQPDQVLARYVATNPAANTFAGASQIVLRVPDIYSNHNGGNILFGGDGYLYWGMGDGGSGGDPNGFAQDLWKKVVSGKTYYLLGKMMRLDVRHTTASASANMCGATTGALAQYAIPPTNPFASQASECAEIWDYGLRNPFRFSFDSQTYDLIIGDVGQNLYEEVDFEANASTGGKNYGWNLCEGRHYYSTSGTGTTCPATTSTIAPVIEAAHSSGLCALIGGYVYRGPSQSLRGTYFYSDNCSGDIYYAEPGGASWDGGNGTIAASGLNAGNTSSFGDDANGNLYVVDLNGRILLLQTDTVFTDGFGN